MADIVVYATLKAKLELLVEWFYKLENRQLLTAGADFEYPHMRNSIASAFDDVDGIDQIGNLTSQILVLMQNTDKFKQALLGWTERIFKDVAIDELEIVFISLADTLRQLYFTMREDTSQTVQAREIQINAGDMETGVVGTYDGTIGAYSSNIGSGHLLFSLERPTTEVVMEREFECVTAEDVSPAGVDITVTSSSGVAVGDIALCHFRLAAGGAQKHGDGAYEVLEVADGTSITVDTSWVAAGDICAVKIVKDVSEIPLIETMHCKCMTAATNRSESFRIGGGTRNPRHSYLGQGSGSGKVLIALGNKLTNGNFENWTSTDLDNWTATTGTYGTDMLKEVTIKYAGSSCLEIAPDAAAWQIDQALTVPLKPWTLYCVGLWVYRATGGDLNLTIEVVKSDAATRALDDHLEIDFATLAADTTWYFQYIIIQTRGTVGTDWRLAISGPGTDTVNLCYIDNIQFGEMTQQNYLHWALLAGAVNFAVKDRFGYGSDDHAGIEIELGTDGVYQKFLGRNFGEQLPSLRTSPTWTDPTTPPGA